MKNAIVIGNGPAGISAAIYLARANINTKVIGKDTGSLANANIENYYGFPEPISGNELVERGINQAKRVGAEILNDEVLSVSYSYNDDSAAPIYSVKTTNSEYLANAVLISVGQTRKKSSIKNLDSLEGMGVSYCAICDAFFYRGKDVAVIGNGEYALHETLELIPIANSVTVLTNGLEATATFPDSIKVINSKISSLNTDDNTGALSSVSFESGESLDLSGVFIAQGMVSSVSIAKKMGIFTEGSNIIVNDKKETNLPGIYAGGDCTGGLMQVAKAVSDGAIAGISMIQYLRN